MIQKSRSITVREGMGRATAMEKSGGSVISDSALFIICLIVGGGIDIVDFGLSLSFSSLRLIIDIAYLIAWDGYKILLEG